MEILEDFACTLCSCVCDDLRLTVRNARIVRAERACSLAEPWLLGQDASLPEPASVDGRPAAYETALARSAEILVHSRYPLIFGLSRSSTEGQRAAVRLADLIGATIDTTASRGHAPSVMAVQQVGESTCSLGEVKNRSDLVILWGCNPVETHPRHLERYAADCPGLFVPGGRDDRSIVVVDVQPTATSRLADLFVQIERGADFELLCTLRSLLRGLPLDPDACGGAPPEAVRQLAQRMTACHSGVVFFGFGLARRPLGHLAIEVLLRLVGELNDHTRFYARRLRGSGDVTGADSVLAWQTGYPFSVNLARGFPRYNPVEFSANEMLERGEPDACLLVGSYAVRRFAPRALRHLERIPVVVLDPPTAAPDVAAAVRFTTSVYGIHRAGTAYRMDEIPIPLRAPLPPRFPADHEVLDAIADAWRAARLCGTQKTSAAQRHGSRT